MKNIIKSLLAVIFAVIVFSGCKKEGDTHPQIATLDPVFLSSGKVLFKGNLAQVGTFEVLDYGFVYGGTQQIDENNSTKISLGKNATSGDFQQESEVYLNGYYGQTRYLYTRAYIQNSKGIAYGDVKFINLPGSSASNVTPGRGAEGDLITINGQFYTNDISKVVVTFGGISAKVTAVTANKITVEVPSVSGNNTYNGQVSIRVVINGATIADSYSFIVLPKFNSFAPKSGPIGTRVYMYGSNISSSGYTPLYRIFFGDKEVSGFYSSGTNEISTNLLDNVSKEKFQILAVVDGKTTILPDEFTVTKPVITSTSTDSALPGTTITFSGTGFPLTSIQNSKINVGGSLVTANYLTANTFSFVMPSTLTVGDYDVEWNIGPFVVKFPKKLTIKKPVITSFSPTLGTVSQDIIINGEFQANTNFNVSIGGVTTSGYSNSTNSLRVNVPYGAALGKTKISISYGAVSVTSADDFTVVGPEISSFSPTSAVAGTVITINGQGFNTYAYNNTVKFGSIVAQILTATATKLTVLVPSNITPSAMKISVTINGQTIISTDNFTVTN